MDTVFTADQIVRWLDKQLRESGQKGFVVGVSGGLDSAVVSTLCAMTGHPVICASLPIYQKTELADRHIAWLTARYPNVSGSKIDLSYTLDRFEHDIWESIFSYNRHSDEASTCDLVSANLKSRLRMCTLYTFANASGFLVAGTGNKVEDFGTGFFTKHGDGGVDLSPIGDLLKSEVRLLAIHLGIADEIVQASPTDGLWPDGRTDEQQIGASYDELERAMTAYSRMEMTMSSPDLMGFFDSLNLEKYDQTLSIFTNVLVNGKAHTGMTKRDLEVLQIYHKRHTTNRHKMQMPPVCFVER